MKRVVQLICLCWIAGFFACNTTKYVPQGQYLLEKVNLKMEDKGVNKNELLPFIQQKPNDSELGLWIYGLVDNDSSSWFKRNIRKLGEAPVIFNPRQVDQSEKQLIMEMKNRGYLLTTVSSSVDTADKKARVEYRVTNNEPYRIRKYNIDVSDYRIDSILEHPGRRSRPLIKSGTIFDMNILEKERERISTRLRNHGYFTFTEDNLHYLADTTLRSNQVDLSMILRDTTRILPYRIRKVSVYSGYDPLSAEGYKIIDTIHYKGIEVYYDSVRFLRPSVISENVMVKPGELFRERNGERTYNYFNRLGSMSRVNVQYAQAEHPDSALLDCNIYLTPGNIHSIQTGVEGTNKAGDLGMAANITYSHHNLFNGSEAFSVRLRGAYEFVSGGSDSLLNHNFYEFGINPSLTFPQVHLPFVGKLVKGQNISTQYNAGFDIQKRPEYIRDFFNLSWKILWESENRSLSQNLSILDINYVIMPWKSEKFSDYLNNQVDPLTKYSYEDVFTAGISYGLIYTNKEVGHIGQNLYTLRFNAETSGNMLGWIFDWAGANKSSTGQYNILGNPFAQYVKGDIDLAQTKPLDRKNTLAFHVGLGVAYPYKNSSILPFEKRYYAGGPNSIRGWSTRYLGPGSFNQGDAGDPSTHVGDIKLELSMEYRYKWLKWLELATFIDAGNIWTIKEYSNQPGGYFRMSSFYKEIAVGTGIGLRLDLSFLILRLDAGTRVYDPALPEGDRWMFLSKRMSKNSAVYLAIGYPF